MQLGFFANGRERAPVSDSRPGMFFRRESRNLRVCRQLTQSVAGLGSPEFVVRLWGERSLVKDYTASLQNVTSLLVVIIFVAVSLA